MRAVVLADTHMPRRGRELPAAVFTALDTADVIFHLGDFTGIEVVQLLEPFAPLHGVHGNNDSESIRYRFPAMKRLPIEGHRFVLLHGDVGGRTALAAARAVVDADVVLFGHSHREHCEREGGRLLFNPGSPTDRRWSPSKSFGMLDIGETVEAHVVRLP